MKSHRKGAVAVAVFAALAAAGCTSAGTGTTPSQTPLSSSSSTTAPPSIIASPAPAVAGGIVPVHDPGQVTGTLTGPCHTQDNGMLPDPRCTPGSYDPAVTQANLSTTLCVKHIAPKTGKITYDLSAAWKAGRPPTAQTNDAKFNTVDPAYGIPVTVKGELDHLDAREIGGSNDFKNLWLEAGSIPNKKDAIENILHAAVCSGEVTLRAAQVAIATNWTTATSVLGVKG